MWIHKKRKQALKLVTAIPQKVLFYFFKSKNNYCTAEKSMAATLWHWFLHCGVLMCGVTTVIHIVTKTSQEAKVFLLGMEHTC